MTGEHPAIGLYCLIFGLYWRIQLKRANLWKGVVFYAVTANFILCTVFFIISIIRVQFLITVSHIQVLYYCSDVMAPNMSLNIEFPVVRAERNFIVFRYGLDDYCN